MLVKPFLLAVVCVSSVQVRGDAALDKNIKEALQKVDGVIREAYSRAYYTLSYAEERNTQTYRSNKKHLNEALLLCDNTRRFLRDFADVLIKEASESGKKEVVSCVKKVQDVLKDTFADIANTVKFNLMAEFVEADSKFRWATGPFSRAKDAASYELSNFGRRIKNCTTEREVTQTSLYYEIDWKSVVYYVLDNHGEGLNAAYKQYDESVKRILLEHQREIASTKFELSQQMKKCFKGVMPAKSGILRLINLL